MRKHRKTRHGYDPFQQELDFGGGATCAYLCRTYQMAHGPRDAGAPGLRSRVEAFLREVITRGGRTMKTMLALSLLATAFSAMAGSRGTTYRQDRTTTTRDAQGRTLFTQTCHTNADGSVTKTTRDAQGRTIETERSAPPTRYPNNTTKRR